MSALKSLSLTALPRSVHDPVLARRNRLIERLVDQARLLKDPNHTRMVPRWSIVEGQRTRVEKAEPVKPWWRQDPDGKLYMCVKSGNRALEFEKGKAAVVVPSKEKLPGVINALIEAAKAGELDGMLAASKPKGFQKQKKAA